MRRGRTGSPSRPAGFALTGTSRHFNAAPLRCVELDVHANCHSGSASSSVSYVARPNWSGLLEMGGINPTIPGAASGKIVTTRTFRRRGKGCLAERLAGLKVRVGVAACTKMRAAVRGRPAIESTMAACPRGVPSRWRAGMYPHAQAAGVSHGRRVRRSNRVRTSWQASFTPADGSRVEPYRKSARIEQVRSRSTCSSAAPWLRIERFRPHSTMCSRSRRGFPR